MREMTSEQRAADALLEKFSEAYVGVKGRIEGGDGTVVILNVIAHSAFSSLSRQERYGIEAGKSGIMADFLPYEPAYVTDPSAPPVTFPLSFEGTSVHYREGSVIRAGC